MPWMAAILPVVYVPGWTGAALPTGWLLLSFVLPLLVPRRIELTEGHWLGALFLGYASLSLVWTTSFLSGVEALWHWAILGLAFVIAANSRDMEGRDVYLGLALGISVSCLIAIPQWFGWKGIFQFHPVAGLFVNSNGFGEACAVVLVLLASQARRSWFLIGLMGFGLLISQARVAMVATAAGLLIQLRSTGRVLLALLILAGALAYATQLPGMSHYKATSNSFTQRIDLYLDTFEGLTFRGHGVGAFQPTYPLFASRQNTMKERPANAHNEFLEATFNFGLGVVPLFLLLFYALANPARPETYGMVTLLVIAAFSQPLAIPVTAFLAAYMAGRLYRAGDVVRDYRSYSRQMVQQRVG